MNILVAILGLAFLILIHEAGHFLAALGVRMRPRKFYVGFPPALVKRKIRGVEYGLGTIPLGGYVKIPGMHRPAGRDLDPHFSRAIDEAPWLDGHVSGVAASLYETRFDDAKEGLVGLRKAVDKADLSDGARKGADRAVTDVGDALSRDAYWRAPFWKRVTVIFAGPAANLLFAVAMLAVVFMLGVPTDTTNRVDRILEDSPAEAAGLQPGDEVVAINGIQIQADEISQTIRDSRGEDVVLTVSRDGEEVRLAPSAPEEIDGRFRLGFVLDPRVESFGPATSVRLAAEETWFVTKAIGDSLGNIVTGSGRDDIATPVGIVQGSSEVLEDEGVRVFLRILAFISLSLALLNLLPLLPLDGGHIAFSVIEKLRGRALPREAYERFSAVGIAVVLLLFVIGISNDIGRLSGG